MHQKQPERFLKIADLRDRYSCSDMSVYRWIKALGFPQPVYFGRFRHWRLSDIEAWEIQRAKPAALS